MQMSAVLTYWYSVSEMQMSAVRVPMQVCLYLRRGIGDAAPYTNLSLKLSSI